MWDERRALEAAILADTLMGTIAAGSTVNKIVLLAGEGLNWEADQLLYLEGAGVTANNDGYVTKISSISGDELNVSPAIPVAPVATEEISGGCKEWLWYENATRTGCYYGNPFLDPGPVQKLGQQGTDRAVLVYECLTPMLPVMKLLDMKFRFYAFARHQEYVEGLCHRIWQRFNGRPDRLTMVGREVKELVVNAAADEPQKDRIRGARFDLRIASR